MPEQPGRHHPRLVQQAQQEQGRRHLLGLLSTLGMYPTRALAQTLPPSNSQFKGRALILRACLLRQPVPCALSQRRVARER